MRTLLFSLLLTSSIFAAEIPRPASDIAIKMPDGKQKSVSEYRGNVLCLAFILTTCSHCQKAVQDLTAVEKELGSKGFRVLAAAINEDANVPQFMQEFKPSFPVGVSTREVAGQSMKFSPGDRAFMPFLLFIDRKGIVRAQYTGADEAFFNDGQKNIREEAEKLLGASAAAGKSPRGTR
jgi:thiol-disulfide isomerase/thioredoxin